MSEVKLIIPRQPYGNLQRPGAGRVNTELSPEGMAALERLTTCSRGAVLDLAVQLLDAIVTGDSESLDSMADRLLVITDDDCRGKSTATGLSRLAWRLVRDSELLGVLKP